jgi:hypothetical protein
VQNDGSIRERGRAAALGDWTNVPFNAADYTGSGAMTWAVAAGNVSLYRYSIVGKTAFVEMDISGAILGGTASTSLRVALPAAITPATGGGSRQFPVWLHTGSAANSIIGMAVYSAGIGRIDVYCHPNASTLWTIGQAPRITPSFFFAIN